MSNHNKMAAIALSLGVSLGTMAQSPIVYAKTMDVKEVASTTEAKEYTVSTDEELANALDAIKAQSEKEAVLTLKADLKVPTQDYKAYFGVAGKHIVVKSDGLLHKLYFPQGIGILTGDCTFDDVTVSGYRLFCGGYATEFTENSKIQLSETLYGGGYKTTVNSTHVVIAGNGYINPSSYSGLHDVIGGSYQGSVKGDTYLEITGNIKMQGGNHLNPGCMKGDGSSGDGRDVSDVYVGGNATLIYDNKSESTPYIEGTYGCEMKGNVTLDVRAGNVDGIVGTEEPVEKSIIHGNLHIIAGAPEYENTDSALRLAGNWPIVGAGNSFATYPGVNGNYTVGGNITIDTYENAWAWDKETTPDSYDLPEIYGALRGNVGGNITINAHGSHVQNIFGASDSVVQGSVTVNATDVELKNSEYDTEYDEGYIFGLWERGIPATANGPVTVNVNGGDVGLVMATDQETVSAGSSINVTGKPKIRTGIRGTQASSYSKDYPVANINDCEATIPFTKGMSQVNITGHSNVTAHIMTSNAGLLVEKDNTLTTDDNQVWIWGDTVINGTWEQLHSQTEDYNDIFVSGTTIVGPNGFLINHGTSNLKGNVTNKGTIAFLGDAYLQGDFISDDGELRLPVVSENYNGSNSIDMMVKKSSTGNSKVLIVDPSDYTKAVNPQLGDNYILSNGSEDKKEKEEVIYYLQNENKKDGYFLKSTDDMGGDYTNMWQVAKISSYKVQYEFKSGTDEKELPQEVIDLLPEDDTDYPLDTEIKAKKPEKTTVEVEDGFWNFDGYDKDSLKSNENAKFIGTWKFEYKKYSPTYKFISNSEGKELPDEVNDLLPVDNKKYVIGSEISAMQPEKTTVKTTEGVWVFGGYEKDKLTSNEGVTFTGKWNFHPNATKLNEVPSISASDKTLTVGDTFDAKKDVTAKDTEDGDLTGKIEVVKDDVDTTKPGTYEVVYKVTDSKGASKKKTIKVTVNPKMEMLNEVPSISANDKTITVGDTFDAKKDVTAKDTEDGDLTGKIEVVKNDVDTTKSGTYEVVYKVTDSKGASKKKTIKVTVNPKMEALNEVPSISASDKTLTVGDTFDAKKDVTAKDTEDGDLTDKIEVVKNDVDTTKPGTYEVTYKVTDSKGASKKKTVYVTVNPKMEEINWIPVISASDRALTVGDVFNVMDGVSASDHEDGDITGSVVVESSNVDTNTVGSYQVTYRVTDSQGASSTKTITVIVNPKMEEINWMPVISASDKVLTVGDVFNVMDGVSASDHEDGDVTGSVVVESSNVDTNTVGSYQVTYRVTDSQGASSTKTITVIVNPKMEALNEVPVINAVDKILTVGDTFDVKKDATASDAEDGNLTDKIEVIRNEVDTGKAGTYEVTYKVTDSQGASSTKTILVTVNPKIESLNEVPTIKAEDKTITVEDKFDVKKDVTATDKEDGDLTDKIEVVKNDVDTTKPGTYEVVYKVTDSKGASKKKTIKVTVNPKKEALNEVPTIKAEDKTITVGDTFDAKKDVTAKDTEDGDLTDKIEVVKNDVDTTKSGTYEVTYKVTDSKGASTTKTIRVTVVKKDVSTSTDKPAKPNNSGKLNTGAQTNMLLWTTSLIASGIAVIGAYRKKRKGN